MTESKWESGKWWTLFAVVMGVMSYMVYTSTAKVYPELLELTVGCCVISIAVSAYNHSLANEPDVLVRRVGLLGIVIIVLLDVGNIWGHVNVARDVSTVNAAEVEKRDREKWDAQLADADARRVKDLMATQAELNRSEADKAAAEARMLGSMGPQARLAYLRAKSQKADRGSGSLSSSLVVTSEKKKDGESLTLDPKVADPTAIAGSPIKYKTEAEAKAAWRGFFSTILILMLVASIGVTFGLTALRGWDKKGIVGVPDWLERVWHSSDAGKQYVRTHYPDHARRIESAIQLGSTVPVGNP